MADAPKEWWCKVKGDNLAQGDYLPGCMVPFFAPQYGKEGEISDVPVKEYDCIIITQSCDLENDKALLVALCPIYSISQYAAVNSSFKEKGAWERVRMGRVEGLHLVASMDAPLDNLACFVVNFREIYSLPVEYVKAHATGLGERWRLQSPFLEHFSQAFARFFMRVGLPSEIPTFKSGKS